MQKVLIIIAIIFTSCGEDKENNGKSNYKKQSDVPYTGKSIDKKGTPNPRGSNFYDPGGYGMVWFDDVRVYFDMSEDYGTPMLFKILGSVGHIIVDEKAREWKISTRSDEDRNQPLTRRPNLIKIPFEGHGMMDMIDTCKESITDILDNNVSCSGEDGMKSLMIPIGIHKSDESGNVMVNFPLDEEDSIKEYKFT